MVIQTSNVAMKSQYFLSRTNLSTVSHTSWGGAVNSIGSTAATTPLATDGEQETGKESTASNKNNRMAWYTGMQSGMERITFAGNDDDYFRAGSTEYDGLRHMLMILSGQQGMGVRRMSRADVLKDAQEQTRLLLKQLGLDPGEGNLAGQQLNLMPTQSVQWSMGIQHYYEERESSSFYSSGTVKTADGRTIEFDIEAEMSRSFAEYTSVNIDYGAVQLMDPLVINLNGGTAEVSDQKFFFDIDCDGELDNVSLLARGCGFLALDRNGDGIINDGSELFGAKSGDGFGDLAVFDMDGNGWIDENDEIFNHLRIWTKDE
ncbi:MAG: hypothetical protein K2O03_04690, partial [Lachnospiraceae bacterium]|nr:hypothetical protein [Lachnospiraceae bacterium]